MSHIVKHLETSTRPTAKTCSSGSISTTRTESMNIARRWVMSVLTSDLGCPESFPMCLNLERAALHETTTEAMHSTNTHEQSNMNHNHTLFPEQYAFPGSRLRIYQISHVTQRITWQIPGLCPSTPLHFKNFELRVTRLSRVACLLSSSINCPLLKL